MAWFLPPYHVMTSSKPKGLEHDVQKMIHTVKIWITLQPLSTPRSGYLLFFFLFALGNIWAERDKMYIRLCAPNEVGDKLMHPRRLMRVFALRLPKKKWIISGCPQIAQWWICGCTCWSESLLDQHVRKVFAEYTHMLNGAHVIRHVLSVELGSFF